MKRIQVTSREYPCYTPNDMLFSFFRSYSGVATWYSRFTLPNDPVPFFWCKIHGKPIAKNTSKGETQSVGPICHQILATMQKSKHYVHQHLTCTYVPTARSRPCLSHWWLLQVGVVILTINLRPKKNQLPFCVCFSYPGLSPQDALGDAKASILWCSVLAIWMHADINCVMLKKTTSTVNSLQAHFSTGIMGGVGFQVAIQSRLMWRSHEIFTPQMICLKL